jgi:hypothetical protein
MDKHTDSEIIDRLGGTTEVARICQIKPPSVSEWRSSGIPAARRQFLNLLRPDVFAAQPPQTERQAAAALVDSAASKAMPCSAAQRRAYSSWRSALLPAACFGSLKRK